ncbi:endolytic transglycosylase MltG [Oceanicoccus sp. KOV_DT_Chl]|uniref:endolytic transglycosylase MltG n=1 Tax=Oceanicoccus sp. KOV_DT_Chl TaxID=1904639 RepID=UPI000C7D4401|nr:endolytic transglycosylase MltG [Oceanicoccus sp. KOV_DT_Chl]
MIKRLFVIAVLLLAVGSVISFSYVQRYMDSPLDLSADGLEYNLLKGSSFHSVIADLTAEGALSNPLLLKIYSRLSGKGRHIKAGDYFFAAGLTPRQLLNKLERGDVRYYTVTLVEGWNLTQVIAALRAQSQLKQTLDTSAELLTPALLGLDKEYSSLEGLLFPDTYRYQRGISDLELLQQAAARLQQVLLEEWQLREEGLPYASPYEALIMASLIEKETGVANERPIIAGVFVRRLQKGMRLQTDPTIIYGLGAGFDGNLRSRHLKDKTNIYNTYRYHGLTPTPIALAGREAIHAALHPAKGDALYFVAKGDGSHYFSSTLEEHQQAVRKYQIFQRSKNYSSMPDSKRQG